MIKKLTAETFAEIASNGLPVDLNNRDVTEYLDDLKFFIASLSNSMWVSDETYSACTISYNDEPVLSVVYNEGKSQFVLANASLDEYDYKLSVGVIINTVYMHSVAWHAINNNGGIIENKIPERFEPWPIQ